MHSFGSFFLVLFLYSCLFALEQFQINKVQTFCVRSGKSHLVVLWKSGLCCLSLFPVVDLSPGLSVVVTGPVIILFFKQLAQS